MEVMYYHSNMCHHGNSKNGKHTQHICHMTWGDGLAIQLRQVYHHVIWPLGYVACLTAASNGNTAKYGTICLMLSLAMHKWLRFQNITISYDLFLRISLSALIQRLRLLEAAWGSWSLIDREITVYQSISTCYCPWYSLKYCFVGKLQ